MLPRKLFFGFFPRGILSDKGGEYPNNGIEVIFGILTDSPKSIDTTNSNLQPIARELLRRTREALSNLSLLRGKLALLCDSQLLCGENQASNDANPSQDLGHCLSRLIFEFELFVLVLGTFAPQVPNLPLWNKQQEQKSQHQAARN